jgi:hypothetical protein
MFTTATLAPKGIIKGGVLPEGIIWEKKEYLTV